MKNNYEKLEKVLGCKWSISIIEAVNLGINRPGALERNLEGISTKVLSERLCRLTSFGLLEKQSFAEMPPRTEYSLTKKGEAFVDIIAKLHDLDQEYEKIK